MAAKGSAGKSASGASMSRYDAEVEGRLKALEAKAHSKCDGGGAKLNAAGLPPHASHKDEAYKRLDALEKRVEALISALS